MKFDIIDNPTQGELDMIGDGINAAVPAGVPQWDRRQFAIFMKDDGGRICGGIAGNTTWGWLQINLFWTADDIRGKGFGKKLLAEAERLAAGRGCFGAIVDTFDFQAREFYEKIGYQVFATIDDFPKGHRRYFLKKKLEPATKF